jgi:protein-S-isoprenylcysteine O-methyltransferase Ste14
MTNSRDRWWPTDLAHWFVVMQGALLVVVLLGPVIEPHSVRLPATFRLAGVGLVLCAIVLGAVSLRRLRPSITTSGALKSDGALVTTGPYHLIRHPVYAAQMLLAFGWSLAFGGWLTALCALSLSILSYFKAHGEERRLLLRFPEDREYKARTRRFIPFIL